MREKYSCERESVRLHLNAWDPRSMHETWDLWDIIVTMYIMLCISCYVYHAMYIMLCISSYVYQAKNQVVYFGSFLCLTICGHVCYLIFKNSKEIPVLWQWPHRIIAMYVQYLLWCLVFTSIWITVRMIPSNITDHLIAYFTFYPGVHLYQRVS